MVKSLAFYVGRPKPISRYGKGSPAFARAATVYDNVNTGLLAGFYITRYREHRQTHYILMDINILSHSRLHLSGDAPTKNRYHRSLPFPCCHVMTDDIAQCASKKTVDPIDAHSSSPIRDLAAILA